MLPGKESGAESLEEFVEEDLLAVVAIRYCVSSKLGAVSVVNKQHGVRRGGSPRCKTTNT